jgi:hypothetical protein
MIQGVATAPVLPPALVAALTGGRAGERRLSPVTVSLPQALFANLVTTR